jgi:hypothetical protein
MIKIEAPSWVLELICTKYCMKQSVRCRYHATKISEIEGEIMEFVRADYIHNSVYTLYSDSGFNFSNAIVHFIIESETRKYEKFLGKRHMK